MNVVMVAEQLRRPVPGGIGTYVRGLCQGLDAMAAAGRPHLRLWASRPPRSGHDPVAELGPAVNSSLPSRVLVSAWDRGLVRAPGDADVLHATSLAVPPAAPATATSVMVHDLAWRRFPDAYPRRGRRWHEAALRRALQRSRLLIVPSAATAGDLVDAGAPASRVEVVEEGCDHLPAPDHAGTGALLSRLGVDAATGFILTVSTIEPRKNLSRLVAAYIEARPALPQPFPLVVVGPAGWGRAPEMEAPGVIAAGTVDAAVLSGLYERAQAFVYVPLWEGFGLPAVEAMRAGVPVVASPVPSTAGAALEVDPLDTAAITAAMVTVLTDAGTRSDLVAAGHRRAGELTWERTARRHVELWQAMTESR